MKRLAMVGALALLGACNRGPIVAQQPVLTPVEVVVPVGVACVPPNMSDSPDYPDTDEALRQAPGAAERYQLLYAGRKVRVARLAELEPVVTGCAKVGAK